MSAIIDFEPDISPDEIAPRTVGEKERLRGIIRAQVDAFLATGGSIDVLPPCVSDYALKEGAKRSFTIVASELAKRGRKPKRE